MRNQRLEVFLKSQEYPTKLILQGITKAESLTTTELRQTKDQSTRQLLTTTELRQTKDQSTRQLQTLPLAITHNPKNPQIVEKIKQDLKFLNRSTS